MSLTVEFFIFQITTQLLSVIVSPPQKTSSLVDHQEDFILASVLMNTQIFVKIKRKHLENDRKSLLKIRRRRKKNQNVSFQISFIEILLILSEFFLYIIIH